MSGDARETVLVIDDNLQNREVAEGHLVSAGYDAVLADGGESGLARFQERRPDLILLDVVMPRMDGFETCRRLRALPGASEVPILFLTALGDLGTHKSALESGADDFLTKPINRTELLMRVRSLLRIRHLSDELRKNYDVIRTQRDALLAGQRQRLELGTLIVHDLKNPLSSILSNVEYLAASDQIPERERESLTDVLRASRSMFRMVMNLLDISRSEDGALIPRCAEFDVTALLNEISSETVRRLEEKGQTLSLTVAPEVGAILADRDLVRRVFENLIDNSHKYSPRNGRISIEVAPGAPGSATDGPAAPAIELRIRDEGTGIPVAYRTRIFEKYVRVEDRNFNEPRNSQEATVGRAVEVPEAFRPVARIHQRWLGGIDPPDHTRLRSLMVRAFTPRRVAGLQPRVDYITGKLIDDALARNDGKIDIIADLSFPLPMSVIGDALGVDEADWGLFRGWAEDVSDAIDRAGDPAAGAAGSAAIEEMFDYFKRLIHLRRNEPADDLLSAMVAAVDGEGQPMQEFDAIAIAVELGFAGHETTMYSVAISVLGLMEQRDRWEKLVAASDDDDVWDPAVDELLRWTTPVQRQRWRWATQDGSIGDREIRRGDPVVSLLGAANRDPEVFPDPDRIDFSRPQARHLTFGFGSHFCLGSALARSELRTALRLLRDRVPHMTLTDPDGVAWRDNSITPGPLAVWVNV